MPRDRRSRIRPIAYFGLPMLFCLAVHWRDLRMWFFNDDFAWLGLPGMVHSPGELNHVLFSPMAEGTVRALSERAFFLVFSSAFGLHSPPFRVWAFLTTFACIALLMQIARRLTGSSVAAFFAPILWTANAGLALAIGWSSAYNEIAFAFFLLLAFWLLLRYIDTGRRTYWIWQWVVFILGFGVLELNIMYPLLAAGYALCCARSYLRRILLLFIPSIVFAAIHILVIPLPTDTYYKPSFSPQLIGNLWRYWTFALGALRQVKDDWRPLWLGLGCAFAVSLALALFAGQRLRRRDWLPILLIAWFPLFILPVLPLQNHFTEYYVTAPAIGLAILGAWGISRSRGAARIAAVALAAVYLTVSIDDNRVAERFYYERSRRMKYLITGLQAFPKADASKKIILAGVDNDLFWTGFLEDPFRLIGIRDIYLLPGTEHSLDAHPEWGGIRRFIISPEVALSVLLNHQGAVYQLTGRRLRDVTAQQLAALSDYVAEHSQFVDVGDSAYSNRLGPTWYPVEDRFRWMPQRATLKMAGPEKAGQMLEVTGFCPAILTKHGSVQVTFTVNDAPIGTVELTKRDEQFQFDFPLPSTLVGRPQVEIGIEVDHTTRVDGDPRELGLVFGTFTIK
ncbi:MAG TPA: hypothetical protein VKX49_05000 [Bryobacteraceae bacterium]|nr:hypothetical protein [Bryobacteraceae bacterium]